MNFFFLSLLVLLETLGVELQQEPLTQSGSLFWISQKSLETGVLAEGHACTRLSVMCSFKKRKKKKEFAHLLCLWRYFHYRAGLFSQQRPTLHLLSILGDKKEQHLQVCSLDLAASHVNATRQRFILEAACGPDSGGRFKHFKIQDDRFIFAAYNPWRLT